MENILGCGKNKVAKLGGQGVKQVLGRIFRPRHDDTGDITPFLSIKDRTKKVDLQTIIDCVSASPDDHDFEIIGKLGITGLKPSDIEIVRAYMHRFGNDVKKPLGIDNHPKPVLLLDENIPQPAMFCLTQIFGWSTHVAAEGLAGRDTPDQNIWEFGLRHKFSAIVTRDTDFLEIQKRLCNSEIGRQDTPLLIFLEENISTESLSQMFRQHKYNIQKYIDDQSLLGCRLNAELGLRPLF